MRKLLIIIITILLSSNAIEAKLPKKHELVGTWKIIKIEKKKQIRKDEKEEAKELIKRHLGAFIILHDDNTALYKTLDGKTTHKGNWSTASTIHSYYDTNYGKYRRVEAVKLVVTLEDNTKFDGVILKISRNADKFGYNTYYCKYHLSKI